MDKVTRPEYGREWFVSPWNFRPEARSDVRRRLIFHDVTLRDGEQQAGVLFTPDEKCEIASALDRLGVDRIEAGMVAVSAEDREAIRAIVASRPRAEIWTIARSVPRDVELALESGAAGTGIILLANDQYCRIFRWTPDEVLAKAIAAGKQAQDGGLKTTLLVADSTRMTRERLRLIVENAALSGCFGAIALMDTFGAISPHGVRAMIRWLRTITDVPLEFHAHNDFGVGTANALAAFAEGIDILHGSVLGIGERIGNCATEEVVLAAQLLYEAQTNIDLSQLTPVAQLVSRRSGMSFAANKPVVGANFTRIESGTVASEFVRWSAMPDADLQWIFPYVPSLVGAAPVELVLCKGSGQANVDAALERLGLTLPGDAKAALLENVKGEASRLHRELTLQEFAAMAARLREAVSS